MIQSVLMASLRILFSSLYVNKVSDFMKPAISLSWWRIYRSPVFALPPSSIKIVFQILSFFHSCFSRFSFNVCVCVMKPTISLSWWRIYRSPVFAFQLPPSKSFFKYMASSIPVFRGSLSMSVVNKFRYILSWCYKV